MTNDNETPRRRATIRRVEIGRPPCSGEMVLPGVCEGHHELYLRLRREGKDLLIRTDQEGAPWPEYAAGWADCTPTRRV